MSDTATVASPEHLPEPTGWQEETLVTDARHALTPSQFVEHKLRTLLETAPLPVSHLQTARLVRR
jgi:hypothetical protein